jgi:tRNA G18 (ribose-2'-O)-methylase SpoU
VVLLKEASHPYHPQALRALSSNPFTISLEAGPSIHELDTNHLVILDKRDSKNSFTWPKDLRLLVGEEGPGIPESLKRAIAFSIPIGESVESLNANVAASISLFDYRTNRPL